MIWNKNLLYQINDVWYHITKLYLVNNEKTYKIKLNHFFLQTAPHSGGYHGLCPVAFLNRIYEPMDSDINIGKDNEIFSSHCRLKA